MRTSRFRDNRPQVTAPIPLFQLCDSGSGAPLFSFPICKVGAFHTDLTWRLQGLSERSCQTGHGTTGWFQIGKGVHQGCILSPCLFNLYAEYTCEMPDWIKHKLESRFPGEISITSDMQMTPSLWKKVKKKYRAS